MKIRILFLAAAAVTLLFFGSCMRSMVTSSALSLSDRKVKRQQVDASAGIGLLPETRPRESSYTAMGFTGKLAYGISDDFNLYGSGWVDLSDKYYSYRGGFSLSSRIGLWQNENSRVELVPRIGVLTIDIGIGAFGLGADGVYVHNTRNRLYYYTGIGLAAGAERLNRIPSRNSNISNYYGIGVIGHLGLGYNITDEWRAVIDLNPVYQYNPVEYLHQFMLSPNLSFGYRLSL
jgi:hypothetical protein